MIVVVIELRSAALHKSLLQQHTVLVTPSASFCVSQPFDLGHAAFEEHKRTAFPSAEALAHTGSGIRLYGNVLQSVAV